jgi:hypothetical protein
MSRARGVDGLLEFGYPAHAFLDPGHRPRDALSLPRLYHRGGAQGQQSHHGTYLEPRRATVGKPQQFVVEAVFFVPHAIMAGFVHGGGDIIETLRNLDDHVLVAGVMDGGLIREFQHVLAEERHPRRAVRLFEVAAGGQRGAAVEDADVVEARNPLSKTFFPKRSLRFSHQVKFSASLLNADLRKSRSASPRRACSVRCRKRVAKACTGGGHLTEVPLVRRHLTIGVQVTGVGSVSYANNRVR